MSEAEALVLDRSMRTRQPETAIEQGWLLEEMESRCLALVETLPRAVQQLVREGKIAAAIALRYLAPVARVNAEHCQRMAEAFTNATQPWTTRQAGELYRAWRKRQPLDARTHRGRAGPLPQGPTTNKRSPIWNRHRRRARGRGT